MTSVDSSSGEEKCGLFFIEKLVQYVWGHFHDVVTHGVVREWDGQQQLFQTSCNTFVHNSWQNELLQTSKRFLALHIMSSYEVASTFRISSQWMIVFFWICSSFSFRLKHPNGFLTSVECLVSSCHFSLDAFSASFEHFSPQSIHWVLGSALLPPFIHSYLMKSGL